MINRTFWSSFCNKSDFRAFKNRDFLHQGRPRPQITPKIARIANALNNRVFDGLPIKTEP